MGVPAYTLSVDELRAMLRDVVRDELKGRPEPANDSDIMTREQVAQMLQCHVKSVTKYIAEEGLPVLRNVGRQPRFSRAAVLAWMQGR